MTELKQTVQVDQEEEMDDLEMSYGQMLIVLARAGFIGKVECPTWNETHYLIAQDVISIHNGFRKGVLLNDEPITLTREDE